MNSIFSSSIAEPLSFSFVDFLACWMDGRGFGVQTWRDQVSEQLSSSEKERQSGTYRLERLLTNADAQNIVRRVYEWFEDISTGRCELLAEFQARFQIIGVIGIPRSGGSFLTAELFSAMGHDPDAVPSIVAHDGFPGAEPFRLDRTRNSWVRSIASMSEYLTIVELYYSGTARRGDKIIVPKKLTKAAYAGRFFREILGEDAEYILTLRHPLHAAISTYEKSGGLPVDGRFKRRSAIEKWIARDNAHFDVGQRDISQLPYLEAYIKYWETYHIKLAMSGLLASRKHRLVAYGKSYMEEAARSLRVRFGSAGSPSEFYVDETISSRHSDWQSRAEQAINSVATVWNVVGLEFPREKICA